MRLRDRFKRLTLWNKIGAVAALTSIIGVPLTLVLHFYPFSETADVVARPPVTLHKLFLEDFSDPSGTLSVGFAPRKLERPDGSSIMIEARLHIDMNAAAKFISLFVPHSEYSYETCLFLSDGYTELTAIHELELETQGAGEQKVFSKDFAFNGRIFLYHEDLFSVEQLAEISELYKSKNLLVQFRGSSYLQTEILRRKQKVEPQ